MIYKNIGRERIEDLTCLCSRCHKRFHGKEQSKPAKPVSQSALPGKQKQTSKEKREAKRKKRKDKKARRIVIAGSTKIFSRAEIEEYERQLQHMAEIKR